MSRIDFNQTGGFRLETETLDTMQTNYNIYSAFGEIVGKRAIIKGCEEIGNTVSDGVVYIDGELLKFKKGTKQTHVIINQEVRKVVFENGEEKDTYYTRWVEFGVGTNSIPWADLKRHYPYVTIHKEIRFVGGNVTNDTLPDHWYIADGTNGTDDLRDQFIKVKKANETAGTTTGSHTRTLIVNNLPAHDHDIGLQRANNDWDSDNSNIGLQRKGDPARHKRSDVTIKTSKAGLTNPVPINIEPKRYLVVAIQFIKP